MLHPERRASFDSGHEVDRSADAQCEAPRGTTLLQLQGDDFLLRRSDRQKTETKWTRCFDFTQARFDCRGVADEIHRRIDMMKCLEPETSPQTLRLRCRAAD